MQDEALLASQCLYEYLARDAGVFQVGGGASCIMFGKIIIKSKSRELRQTTEKILTLLLGQTDLIK